MIVQVAGTAREKQVRSTDVVRPAMRVLYFIAYPHRMAGANRSLFELVSHLPKTIHPVILLVRDGEVARVYRQAGCEVHVVTPGSALNQFGKAMLRWSYARKAWVSVKEYIPYALKLWTTIRRLDIDIVHVNDPRGALMIGPAARLARRPIVSHLRGEKPFGGLAWHVFETVPCRIIIVSAALASSLSPRARAKSVTAHNGTKDISGPGRSIRWLDDLRARNVAVVCCFASVVPFKGHHHLLDAAAELNRRGWGDRVVFVCVGDLIPDYQEYQVWLFRRQRELGVHNLLWTGWQPDPFAFYRSADISVLPSLSHEELHIDGHVIDVRGSEGFPRTHLEAMCFGLPIVGTDIAGVREQIEDGINGFVVPPSDPAAIAGALEKLLVDTSLRARMGQAGRRRVLRDFSTDTYVAKVLAVYTSLIPGPTRRA
jgi:glycosyltransferase involved in cell wall biosynthesis